MSKFRQVSHVIFDMDGVLLDTEPLYSVAIQNVVSKYEKTFTWDLKLNMMGLHRHEGAKFLVKELDLPIAWEEYDRLVHIENAIATIARRFGKVYTHDIVVKVIGTVESESARIAVNEMSIPMPVREFQKEFRHLSHSFFAKKGAPLMPGAKKLVEHLSKNNIPISVATSSTQDAFDLKSANHKDFFKLFDHIVCGGTDSEVKHGKPAPDIFLVSAARFPDKPNPEKCLVFEDSPNGVKAALKAGMQVVMIPDENVPMNHRLEATYVVTSLDETPLEKFGLPPIK